MSADLPIHADFAAVAGTAADIRAKAQEVQGMLESFKNEVATFVAENWENGRSSAAFQELQAKWDQQSQQLQTTLDGAAQLVNTGNSDLQSTDTALAGLF